MTENDFSVCPFIRENMWFFTFNDFYENRKVIKRMYQGLKSNEQIFYKWYVYANIDMGIKTKNRIWDYLNGDIDDRKLMNNKK